MTLTPTALVWEYTQNHATRLQHPLNFREYTIKILDVPHYLIIDNEVERSTIKWNGTLFLLFLLHPSNGAPEKSEINVFGIIAALVEDITPERVNTSLPQFFNNLPSTATIV